MNKIYISQALPSKEYLELLGTALCVFNANNAFIIENILHVSDQDDWYILMDSNYQKLKKKVRQIIANQFGFDEIANLYDDLVQRRGRIVHSFQITDCKGDQILATKTPKKEGHQQFIIDESYLMDFIKSNDDLSKLLHSFRGY